MRLLLARLPALLAMLGGIVVSVAALAHDPACSHHADALLGWAGPGVIGVVGIVATVVQAVTRPVAGRHAPDPDLEVTS